MTSQMPEIKDSDILVKIADLFRLRSGWKIAGRDWVKFHSCVMQRIALLKLDKMSSYYQKLVLPQPKLSDEFCNLASLMVNSESYFFRDKGQQAALQNHIFPTLIKAKSASKQLKIWSAGCSTGEEAYSLAMMLSFILPNWREWKLTILGTDLNGDSIKKAEKGEYRENSMRDVDIVDKNRFFTKVDKTWHVLPTYQPMVKFQQGNLVEDQFPSLISEFQNMDLIVCRNVFIYFNQEAITRVVQKFAKTLQRGGILMLGHGEAQVDETWGLKGELLPGALIYKKM